MKYFCKDRGGVRCPCHLMTVGQCYSCNMIKEGICHCDEAYGWQGTCPYTEYIQQGRRIRENPSDSMRPYFILRKICFGSSLMVVRLKVPCGFAEQCRRPGAYIMTETLGWRMPISVLRVRRWDPETGSGWVEFLIKMAGPKSNALAETETAWNVAGPYFGGLIRTEQMKELPPLIIVRGAAAAPFVHLLDWEDDSGYQENTASRNSPSVYIDTAMLPGEFLDEYMEVVAFTQIDLTREETSKAMKHLVKETAERGSRVLLLVSPYYAEILTDDLSSEALRQVTLPNPANLCCGMGLCGSCSCTDRDGVTVKLCKCTENVIE